MTGAFPLLVLLAGAPALAVECGDTITGRARLDRDLICPTQPPDHEVGGLRAERRGHEQDYGFCGGICRRP
jgi:hypothetical protein